MKIGILTLPLWNNYGGIIQAYALKKVLNNLGHDVTLIDYHHHIQKKELLKRNILRFFKHRILRVKNAPFYPNISENRYISKNTLDFIKKEFPSKTIIIDNNELLKSETAELDAIIVGSDQVWRPNYTPDIANYFLKFATNNQIKIAYAASLGTDKWIFNKDEQNECKSLVKKFEAISVREDSAVGLLKEKLDIDAVQLVDPTMLITAKDYRELMGKYSTKKSEGKIFTYILDQTEDIKNYISKVESELGEKAYEVMPRKFDKNFHKNKSNYVFPSLLQWLRAFEDAEYVIADSFHGCVFSIIFNKPFIAIGNKERGMARFHSLLKLFNLEDRLVFDVNNINQDILKIPIDWDAVNKTLEEQKELSQIFLKKSLNA
ncbi:MAG: polysaccharide pyruvyl transferase family protein [Chryseobacterium sp.]|nr:MAG: polysaccharide pyruvyl transferase family protein [Chryseobacterium sp.]